MGLEGGGVFVSSAAQIAPGVVSNSKLGTDIAVGGNLVIFPWAYTSIGAGTFTESTPTATDVIGYFPNAASSADGDNLNFSVYLAAGTYTLVYLYRSDTDAGITKFKINTALVATVDENQAAGARRATQAGIVIATNGLKTLQMIIDGHTGTDYIMRPKAVILYRTA